MDQSPRLTFYYRDGCHLCEDMWQQLQNTPGVAELVVEQVDITTSNELSLRYGGLIPVLACGEEVLCNYYLDPISLQPFLKAVV